VAWLDTTLKLEAKDRRLELRPTPDGIVAVFLHNGKEERRLPVDLTTASGSELVQEWFGQPRIW
jgi:antitoxin component of RelBE/YafQ-DinJ toxin-antitoxin module